MSGYSEEWLAKTLAQGNVQLADEPRPRYITPVAEVTVARETGKKKKWSAPEVAFAKTVLQPMLERGEILWWTDQVEIHLTGQTYTPDFMAMGANWDWIFYEVKGSFGLGSEDRSSVKLRFFLLQLQQTDQPIPINGVRVLWCKQLKDKTFKIREVVNTRRKHPILRQK